ncbi:methoxymalonate biosynthesis protein [Streptomyces populi]|uniref:Methoxymalonate biosynthesis protein n=1 Tax=Streptomyces populi TaxID=2058924 RepID=A0A2I0SBB4_9ACTN|nr:acyl carrier protein [Streptomyces populi]PKT67218.1 methoxymalonate biosynthesis protein [Streptomyces populi]
MTTSPNAVTVEESIQAFLRERTKRSWELDVDLFATGGVSSLFAMELVVHLEKTFSVTIAGPDLMIDNFRTVRTMTALVGRLRGAGDSDE